MCDFYDFGLTFFSINVFFVLLKMSKNVFWVVARLPQRLKSTFFEIFSSLYWPILGRSVRKNFKKTLILAFEANSATALSCVNETKIVKITHSELETPVPNFQVVHIKKKQGRKKALEKIRWTCQSAPLLSRTCFKNMRSTKFSYGEKISLKD